MVPNLNLFSGQGNDTLNLVSIPLKVTHNLPKERSAISEEANFQTGYTCKDYLEKDYDQCTEQAVDLEMGHRFNCSLPFLTRHTNLSECRKFFQVLNLKFLQI